MIKTEQTTKTVKLSQNNTAVTASMDSHSNGSSSKNLVIDGLDKLLDGMDKKSFRSTNDLQEYIDKVDDVITVLQDLQTVIMRELKFKLSNPKINTNEPNISITKED